MILIPTQEIGSLDKMGAWRRKGVKERAELEPNDWNELRVQRTLYGIEGDELPFDLDKALRSPQRSEEQRRQVKDWSALFAIRLFEKAGLEIIGAGEQMRSEMFQQPTANISGFESRGWVRSWGNKYWKSASLVAEPCFVHPFHLHEYAFTRKHASQGKRVKTPITGAYTLADWSFDEFYLQQYPNLPPREAKYRAKHDFAMALARNAIRPHIQALVQAGADYIQIDEPAGATKPEEVGILVNAYNESVRGLDGMFSLHICFTDYPALFPAVRNLEKCDMFTWEFANRGEGMQSYRDVLALINNYTPDMKVGLGVLDVHTDDIEPPDLVRDRLLYAADVLGPEKIYANPDCGLRTRSTDVAYRKLCSMVEGTQLARESLGV